MDHRKLENETAVARGARAATPSHSVQKTLTTGASYDERVDSLKPNNSVTRGPVQMLHEGDMQHGQEYTAPSTVNRVTGPIGCIFNRILGVEESRTDTGGMAFNAKQLRRFLDKTLALCKGEFFRGTKLERVTAKLMETLDTNGDGLVGWPEFQVFREQVLTNLASGIDSESSGAEVEAAAGKRFDTMNSDSKSPDEVTFDELQGGLKQELPGDTEHKGIVSQLGALFALEAIGGSGKRSTSIRDRTLSKEQWISSVSEMHKNSKGGQ